MERIRLTFQQGFRGDLMMVAVGVIVVALACRVIALALRDRQIGRSAVAMTAGALAGLSALIGLLAGLERGASFGILIGFGVGITALVLWAWLVVLIWRRGDLPSLLSMVLAAAATAWMDAAAFVPSLREPAALAPIAIILCVLTVLVFYQVVYRFLGAWRIGTLLALRCLAIFVLLALLFRPVLSVLPLSRTKPLLLVLLDVSKSMSVQDAKNAPTRYEQVVETCQAVLPEAGERFDVRYYVFDARPRAVESAEDLFRIEPAGDATNLVLAAQEVVGRHPNQEILAVCLLTDGNHNAPGDPVKAARSLGVPLHTVGVGTEEMRSDKLQDISIAAVDAPDEAAAHNVSTIKAHIAHEGLANRTIEVRLADGPQQLDKQTLVLSDKQKIHIVELRYKPTTTGRKRLTVSVPVDPAELIGENNAHDVHLLVTDPQIKVLYIEGAVRPEFKFLRRFLGTDPNLELATLIQVRPPLFAAGGTVGGKPLKGFPQTADDFKAFDVFLIGDLDRTYLTKQQMDLLVEAVRAGKGLLMIGGTSTLGPGGYAGSPIESMLPVTVGPRSKTAQETTPFVPRLTAEGRVHPVFAGLVPFFDHSQAAATPSAEQLPPLQGCVIVEGPKPAASVLAEHPSRQHQGRPICVLAVQTFGSGRTAVFTADTTWRWYMFRRALGAESPYHRFWGQLVRWLASSELREKSTESGVQVQVARSFYHPGEQVEIVAKVRDEEGQATNYAGVVARVTEPGESVKELPLARRPERVGVYEVSYEPSVPGAYVVEVVAQKQDKQLGKDAIDFVLGRPSAEFEKLSLDSDRLTKMASAGQGEYLRLPGLSDLVAKLLRGYELRGGRDGRLKEVAVFTAATEFARHAKMAAAFGLFVILITCEWLLRRHWQLG